MSHYDDYGTPIAQVDAQFLKIEPAVDSFDPVRSWRTTFELGIESDWLNAA
jgi:hypothetical protein